MNFKKIFSSIDKISFAYKSAFLLFIIIGGMIIIIILSQISIYTIKNDFDLLFEKKIKSIISLESIKDTYDVNINETLKDMKDGLISKKQANEVISLADELINKSWNNYSEIMSSKKYKMSFINKNIKELFNIGKKETNIILKNNIINNINKRKKEVNILLEKIFNDTNSNSTLIQKINYEVNSISIFINNLLNYDLSITINEKLDTDKIFKILSIILNISIIITFIFSALLSFFIILNFKKLHIALQGDLLHKTEALERLNQSLEEKITQEVSNSRKKDIIMFQQARLASMGEMIANIAHQWRQPLSSIMIIIQGLQTKMQLGKLTQEKMDEKVNDALLLGDNMSQTLENFQHFFKPIKGKETFLLYECITHSLELSKYRVEKNDISVSIKASKNLQLYNFYNKLSHVLLNIISNATDALKLIDGKKFIDIIVKEVQSTIYIYIIDNGGGIKEEILPHIFEPYFTTKYKSEGTGLGLYMTKQILEKHMQGIIRCKNICYTMEDERYPKCTLFTIIMPNEKKDKDEK